MLSSQLSLLNSTAYAQAVLDMFHSGSATILGKTPQGFPIVRVERVTGTNIKVGEAFLNQPTNVFIIKGKAKAKYRTYEPKRGAVMKKELDLNTKNAITVMLMQALWGAISPNFRMIALSFSEPKWQLLFVLEIDDAADREEIEDVVGEFDALLLGLNAGTITFETKVVIDSKPLAVLNLLHWITVYRRRES